MKPFLLCTMILSLATPALAATAAKPPPKPVKCDKGDVAIRDKQTGKLSCYRLGAAYQTGPATMIGTPQPIPAKPKPKPAP